MSIRVSSARAIGLSLAVGAALGIVSGVLFALLFDREVVYGIGAMTFLTGVIALVMGLLGALEPEQGWATGRGTQSEEMRARRSLAARVSEEHPNLQSASGWALAAWGVAVGGPLIALSVLAFHLAAR